MKASQIGLTVLMICEMMAQMMAGRSGMYVMPTDSWMGKFVRNRIDPMVPNVPFYRAHYATRGRVDVKNVSMKTFFNRRVVFSGANVVNNFYEMPASWYVIDELDRCKAANLKYLDDRLSRQQVKIKRMISNPTFEGVGIHAEYQRSDQKRYLQKCPACNEWQELTYWANIVRQVDDTRWVLQDRSIQARINDIARRESLGDAAEIVAAQLEQSDGGDATIYCHRCQRPIDRFSIGKWEKTYQDRTISGYTASKVIGDVNRSGAMVRLYQQHNASLFDPSQAQRFRNNDLAEPYREPGSSITDELLDACVYEYQPPLKLPWTFNSIDIRFALGGVDVGQPQLHVWIAALILWKRLPTLVYLKTDIVNEFEEVEDLGKRFRVAAWCVDGQPETRIARAFCRRAPGRYMVFYRKQDTSKPDAIDYKERSLNVNRTESIDRFYARIAEGRLLIPPGWRHFNHGDFKTHLTAPQRVTDLSDDPPKINWTKPLVGDHFLHSGNYLNLATTVPADPGAWG